MQHKIIVFKVGLLFKAKYSHSFNINITDIHSLFCHYEA